MVRAVRFELTISRVRGERERPNFPTPLNGAGFIGVAALRDIIGVVPSEDAAYSLRAEPCQAF